MTLIDMVITVAVISAIGFVALFFSIGVIDSPPSQFDGASTSQASAFKE